MAWETQLDLPALGEEARLTPSQTHAALQLLATSGHGALTWPMAATFTASCRLRPVACRRTTRA